MPEGGKGGAPERQLFSIEAEQAVLGGLLLSMGEALHEIAGVVSVGDFRTIEHRLIFRAVELQVADGNRSDVITLWEALKSRGEAERIQGGLGYLHELAAATPSAANIKRYAEIVRDLATLIKVAETGEKLVGLAREANGLSAAEVLDRGQALLSGIAAVRAHGRGELQQIGPFVTEALAEIDQASRNYHEKGVAGLSSGLKDLDEYLGGFMPGDLIVLGGRPGMGKTALALNITERCAFDLGLSAAIFSMEMRNAQLAKRYLASLSRIHGLRLSHGRIDPMDFHTLDAVAPKLHAAPIFVCQDGGLTVGELSAGARRWRRTNPRAGILVVDYFGLMEVERQTNNTAQDLAKMSAKLKALAKELELPLLLLAQVNRECEKRGDKRPGMSDLRDSGGLEQDADIILFVYREHVYEETAPQTDAEIIVAKQRNGPTRKVRVMYDAPRTRFMDLGSAIG
jgi:replicative DNA helicase